MDTLKPYIDSEYYNNIYKPSKNARIEGTFNNVAQHQLDFDAFRNRASEIVDRLLSGKISELGGIDAMSDTFAKELIKKATAAFVEHWFIKGFVMSDLNSTINIGSLNSSNVISTKNFREIAPFSALANLQKTGMWEHKAVGIKLSTELKNAGIDPSEILTIDDAIAAFEIKGEGLNFHVEGDMSGELTGIAGKKRFIKILETPQEKSSFEIIGGTDEFTKINVEFKRTGTTIDKAEALVYSAVVAPDAASFWYKVEDGKTIIYMEVDDDQDETSFAISNAYPDKEGLYGVLGSTDNSAGLTEMKVVSIIDNIASVSIATIKEYSTLPEFAAEPAHSIGYIKNADGSYDYLIATQDGAKMFRDYDTLDTKYQLQFTAGLAAAAAAQTTANAAQTAAAEADAKAEQNKQDITTNKQNIGLKQDEVGLGQDGNKVIKSSGTFSSKDAAGNRQVATDDDDLVDKEFVEEITKPLEDRTAVLETADGNNLKKTDSKSAVNTSNKLITESEFDADSKNQNDRLDSLEQAEELDDKEWEGSKPFPATGIVDLSGILDQNGNPFDFKDGKKLQIYIKHTNDNQGESELMKINEGTMSTFTIPTGTSSDTISAKIADTGLFTGTITNGNDNIGEYEIYRVIEAKSIKAVSNSYSKTESDAKYATKVTTDNLEADIAELNDGKFDVNGDGTKIVEIFDADGNLVIPWRTITDFWTSDANKYKDNDMRININRVFQDRTSHDTTRSIFTDNQRIYQDDTHTSTILVIKHAYPNKLYSYNIITAVETELALAFTMEVK